MPTRHHISHAQELYWGDAYFPPAQTAEKRRGTLITPIVRLSLGSPIATDADGLVAAATSTELPNAATTTYTTANDGTSPFDNVATPAPSTIIDSTGASRSVWALDVPRNVTIAVTHGSSIVAMSVTFTGFDVYGQRLVETLSVTATGTSKTAAGKKAFASILSIAITSAGNATTNTLDVGWADVLGLPLAAANKSDVLQVWFNDTQDTSATVVKADTTTVSAITGDVRGTVDTNSAADGSAVVVYLRPDPSSKESLYGIDQFAG